nr:MAG TPA: hypothetical protein [Crassvirales sp.]
MKEKLNKIIYFCVFILPLIIYFLACFIMMANCSGRMMEGQG